MKLEDLSPGVTVYNKLYVSWGKGMVIAVAHADGLETLFERGSRFRVVVKFESMEKPVRLMPKFLRATPNRKRIKEMVAYYQSRDVKAIDGGDRLILPGVHR